MLKNHGCEWVECKGRDFLIKDVCHQLPHFEKKKRKKSFHRGSKGTYSALIYFYV